MGTHSNITCFFDVTTVGVSVSVRLYYHFLLKKYRNQMRINNYIYITHIYR